MKHIEIRKVGINDSGFLCTLMNNRQILTSLNEVESNIAEWEEAINIWDKDSDEENFLIISEGTPVGWIGINGLSSLDRQCFIKIIAILPEYQNMGYGEYAIKQIKENLKQRNYKTLSLYTNGNNFIAQSCYKKCGFKIIDKFTETMSDGETVERFSMRSDL